MYYIVVHYSTFSTYQFGTVGMSTAATERRGGMNFVALQYTANQKFAIHQSSMQSRELNSCA